MTFSNIDELLAKMSPKLDDEKYYFASIDQSALMAISGYLHYVVDVFREDEGLSIVFMEPIIERMENLSATEIIGPFALISLEVNSDLMAVGFLAKITDELAKKGISVNAFSAYHHDHLFVPFEKKDEVMGILAKLSKAVPDDAT